MSAFKITRNVPDGETIILSRDVRDQHPDWVHEQLGTESESELQAVLDSIDPALYLDGSVDGDGVSVVSE